MGNTINSIKAKKHTMHMQERYSEKIRECIENTEIYARGHAMPAIMAANNLPKQSDIYVSAEDTVSALYKGYGKKQCLLDFASYTKPGGGFLSGSMAQEEALCHESFLYNVMSGISGFYSGNIESGKNDGFYSNRAAYVKNVVFVRGEKETVSDVLVCAAPNWNAASSKRHTKKEKFRRTAFPYRIHCRHSPGA